jgi:hypothetical protein
MVNATGPDGRQSRFSRPKPLIFPSSSSSVILTRLSGSRSRTTPLQKTLVAPVLEPGTSISVARNSAVSLGFLD